MKQPTNQELMMLSYWEYLKTFSVAELLIYCDKTEQEYEDVNEYHGLVRDKLKDYDNELIISEDHEQMMRQFLFLNEIADRRRDNPNFLVSQE